MSEQRKNDNRKSRGRPATGQGLMLGVRLHDDLLSPLDRFIADNGDAPSRPEAVRRALREYLKGKGYLSNGNAASKGDVE